jgi:hypothetical protein
MAVCQKALLVWALCARPPSFGRGCRGTVPTPPSDPGERTRGRTMIGASDRNEDRSGAHKERTRSAQGQECSRNPSLRTRPQGQWSAQGSAQWSGLWGAQWSGQGARKGAHKRAHKKRTSLQVLMLEPRVLANCHIYIYIYIY